MLAASGGPDGHPRVMLNWSLCWASPMCHLGPVVYVQLGRKNADGDRFGVGTGEGPSKGDCPSYKVKIYNHYSDETVEVEVPEDR